MRKHRPGSMVNALLIRAVRPSDRSVAATHGLVDGESHSTRLVLPRRKQQPGVVEGWSDLIKLASAGAAHLCPTHAAGSGRPGAAGRYVRPRSRYARLPR
jgi:hypothetical protein